MRFCALLCGVIVVVVMVVVVVVVGGAGVGGGGFVWGFGVGVGVGVGVDVVALSIARISRLCALLCRAVLRYAFFHISNSTYHVNSKVPACTCLPVTRTTVLIFLRWLLSLIGLVSVFFFAKYVVTTDVNDKLTTSIQHYTRV